jgi:energy-converting hydrogenase B subunit Q
MGVHALVASATDRPGLLFQFTRVLADHGANITSVDIHTKAAESEIHFEFSVDDAAAARVLEDLRQIAGVSDVTEMPPLAKIYGKRIIVIGGGAQVGFVAMGAIAEADRHNIRGERISVDTIPLVGERELAAAVRAAGRLPRARLLVLAGALMGGEITTAVQEVRATGLFVISLNMAGSVPEAADLVVSDPIQAGVMAVMAVADTAKFDLLRLRTKKY